MRAPEGVETEGLLCARPPRGSEAAAQERIADEPIECSCELGRVARLDEQSRLLVEDLFGHAAHARCNHGQTRGHGLQYGDRVALRPARKDECVRGRKQLGDVVALAGEADPVRESERTDLLLELGAIRSLADDQRVERVARETAESQGECGEILRRLEPADSEDQRPFSLARSRARRRSYVHCVRDHDRSLRCARPGRQACFPLVLRDADRHSGQRLDQPIGPTIDPRREPRVRCEGPAVHGEDPDRHMGDEACEAAEHASLRAAGVEDVRSLPTQQARQLDEAREVAPGAERATDVPQWNEADSRGLGRLAEGAVPVRRDRHVEVADEGRQQRSDVGLCPTDLRQRDHEQHPRSAAAGG